MQRLFVAFFVFAAAACGGVALASEAMYKCPKAGGGFSLLSESKLNQAENPGKCKVSAFSQLQVAPAKTQKKPKVAAGKPALPSSGVARSAASKKRVSAGQQRARDLKRWQILQNEITREKAKLQKIIAAIQNSEGDNKRQQRLRRMGQTAKHNIVAIRQELARLNN